MWHWGLDREPSLSPVRKSEHVPGLVLCARPSSQDPLLSGRLSITPPETTWALFSTFSIPPLLLLLAPTLHSPYTYCPNNHSISLQSKRKKKKRRPQVRRISQMHFLTINRNIWAVQSHPFLWKNTGQQCLLVLFFWHMFLIIMMMIWNPLPHPKLIAQRKMRVRTRSFFLPKAREYILGMTWGQSPSSKSCSSEHFSSADISFSE